MLGGLEDWSRVMGGVLEVAGVPGFLGNLTAFLEESGDESEAWRAFVVDWHARFGSEPVATSDLYPLAVELFDLGHGSDRSQLTRLGILLGQARDRRYGDHRIERGRVVHSAQRWRVVVVA